MDFQATLIETDYEHGYSHVDMNNGTLSTHIWDDMTRDTLKKWILVRDAIISDSCTIQYGKTRKRVLGCNIYHDKDGLFEILSGCGGSDCCTSTYKISGNNLLPVINLTIEKMQKCLDDQEKAVMKDDLKKQIAELALKVEHLRAQMN